MTWVALSAREEEEEEKVKDSKMPHKNFVNFLFPLTDILDH